MEVVNVTFLTITLDNSIYVLTSVAENDSSSDVCLCTYNSSSDKPVSSCLNCQLRGQLPPLPAEIDDVELYHFMNDNPFGGDELNVVGKNNVNNNAIDGLSEIDESRSVGKKKRCNQRINPNSLKKLCISKTRTQSQVQTSMEESMYRKGLSAVNTLAFQKCKEYRLQEGELFGDTDFVGEVRKSNHRNSPFRPFEAIITNITLMENALGFDQLHRINRRESDRRLQVICAYHMDPINCQFYIEARGSPSEKFGHCAKIVYCNPYHSCQLPASKDLIHSWSREGSDSGSGPGTNCLGRVRALPMQTKYNCSQSIRNKRKQGDKKKYKEPAPLVVRDFHMDMSSTSMKESQARKFSRDLNNNSYKAEALDLCLLPDLFRKLKECDPDGTYTLNLKPLSYNVKVKDEVVVQAGTHFEFDSYIHIPSHGKSFFKHSGKLISIDGAHCYRKFRGMLLIAVGKDSELSNVFIGHALVPQENKYYWNMFVDAVLLACPQCEFLMSDKAKGMLTSYYSEYSNNYNMHILYKALKLFAFLWIDYPRF